MQSTLLLLCTVSAALSWTFVPVSDFNLVKTSEVIAYGTVKEELSEAPYQTERVYRYYRIDVEDKIFGSIIGDNQTLIVRSLGGYDASSDTFFGYPGSPVLSTNEKVLLFLKRVNEHPNVFDFLHFGLGAFHELSNGDYAYRVSDVTEDESSVQIRKMRDFIHWIKVIASAFTSAIPNYWTNFPNIPSLRSARGDIHARYNTMKSGTTNVKWQTFTQGGTVNWYVNPSGAPALPGGGYVEIQQAFAAWNNATPQVYNVIKYNYAGNTTASGGLSTGDSQNSVLYEDPNNEIAGSFSCSTGGTLAIGGWRARSPAFTWRGLSWYSIVEADMVVQDGISCWISSNPKASKDWANMLTHEFGHTLAMGHSCGDSATGSCVSGSPADLATMRAYLRSGVGAALGDDDKEGINFLYASCWPNCASTTGSTPAPSQATTASAATSTTGGVATPTTGRVATPTTGRVATPTTGRSTTGRSTTGRKCTGILCL